MVAEVTPNIFSLGAAFICDLGYHVLALPASGSHTGSGHVTDA